MTAQEARVYANINKPVISKELSAFYNAARNHMDNFERYTKDDMYLMSYSTSLLTNMSLNTLTKQGYFIELELNQNNVNNYIIKW